MKIKDVITNTVLDHLYITGCFYYFYFFLHFSNSIMDCFMKHCEVARFNVTLLYNAVDNTGHQMKKKKEQL